MHRRFAVLAAVLAVVSACGPLAEPGVAERVPTTLISGLSSYQTPGQVKSALGGTSAWVTIEDSHSGPRGTCPRLDVLSISVPRWSHLGEEGELRLGFVNGKLRSTWFYPDSPDRYFEALGAAGIVLDKVDSIGAAFTTTSHRTLIWRWRAYDNRQYVGWEDQAIQEEVDDWIASCT